MSGRGFPIYVKCPMHGWTVYPPHRWDLEKPVHGCELCGQTRLGCLWFTAKAHVRAYERERREAAVCYRRERSGFWMNRDRRRERR